MTEESTSRAGRTSVPPGGGRHEDAAPRRPQALSPLELARWMWRQLTSMRTALLLLLALAVAAVPGSLVPQQGVDSLAVARFRLEHPDLSPWLDRLGVFSVYASPWFAAIYLLLMVSLAGCIVPRTAVFMRALRARPPRTPARFERLPAHVAYETDEEPAVVLARAEALLRSRRFRVNRDNGPDGGAVRAERGYLREAGNLAFHLSVFGVLVGVAVGSLWGYRGSVILVEGQGFSNTLTQYDEFRSGALADAESLPPFALTLQKMDASFQPPGTPQAGQPSSFEAAGTVVTAPGTDSDDFSISVNDPLTIDGTVVSLVGSGYAPAVTVRDGRGDVTFSGPVAFLPTDPTYLSQGVVKAPDAEPAQLGFEGVFLPSAAVDARGAPVTVFPEALNPELSLFAWTGDLGLDDGQPQSVFSLRKDDLTQVEDTGGEPLRLRLAPGQVARLPDGLGSIRFDAVREFARLQVSASPLSWLSLVSLVAGLVGLLGSLFVRPRRTWVRATAVPGHTRSWTVVEVAGLDRVPGGDLGEHVHELTVQLREREDVMAMSTR